MTGATLFHEHISPSIRYPMTKALAEAQGRPVPASFSDDIDLMIDETKLAKQGMASAVSSTAAIPTWTAESLQPSPAPWRRNRASTSSASGGFYMQRNYPPDIAPNFNDI